mgnify:CR=1 FL=1
MPETGEKDIRPSWVPLKKDPNFACSVMGGIDSAVNAVSEEKYNPVDKIRKFPLRKKPSPEELIKGVSEGDRKTLSQAITLIESNAPRDFDKAQRVLQALLPREALDGDDVGPLFQRTGVRIGVGDIVPLEPCAREALGDEVHFGVYGAPVGVGRDVKLGARQHDAQLCQRLFLVRARFDYL